MWRLVLLLFCFVGCKSGAPHAVTNAVIGSAIGVTASAINRSQGGCYAICPVGTVCNVDSGLCEELPCRGQCTENETCDQSAPIPTCVERKRSPLIVVDQPPLTTQLPHPDLTEKPDSSVEPEE